MYNYLINSIKRKVARRVTKKYPTTIDSFDIEGFGEIKFANWENPLVERKQISKDNIDFFKKFLSEGDLAIDIGTNIGLMTVQMSVVAGLKGLTIGFDPNPFVFEILLQNAHLNSDKGNIAAHNFAITDKDDEFYYNSSEASFNNGGISRQKENRHGKYSLSTKIKGVNLENFLERDYPEFLGKLKLVKIDTEGYDKEIIKSISDLLSKYKPVVITECFGKNSPEARFEQFELLKSIGYSLYYFSDFVANAEIIPVLKKEDMLNWKHFDLYAIAE
ncbi:MAG: FkbM family methyltransferase [Cytophagaceae bacterium]